MPDAALKGISLLRIWLRLRKLEAVDADLGRGVIDQPLHVVIAFGPAGAAIGRDQVVLVNTHLVATSISGVR